MRAYHGLKIGQVEFGFFFPEGGEPLFRVITPGVDLGDETIVEMDAEDVAELIAYLARKLKYIGGSKGK